MTTIKENLQKLLAELKQERDEIALRIHLAKAEARDEWQKLETKWEKLNEDYQPVKDALGESAKEVAASLKIVGEELKKGFERVRKSL